MQAVQVKYRTKETTIPFQGKTITVRNHTPILPPKELLSDVINIRAVNGFSRPLAALLSFGKFASAYDLL